MSQQQVEGALKDRVVRKSLAERQVRALENIAAGLIGLTAVVALLLIVITFRPA